MSLKVWNFIIWLFCLCILCGVTAGQVHCDHRALAKTITGYCINSQDPNGRCCIAIFNAIKRGSTVPCICSLIKDGIKVEKVIKFYYHCGGKTLSVAQLISHCGDSPPPPADGDWKGSPNPYSGGVIMLLVALSLFVVTSICWLIYEYWKCKNHHAVLTNQQMANVQMTTVSDGAAQQQQEVMLLPDDEELILTDNTGHDRSGWEEEVQPLACVNEEAVRLTKNRLRRPPIAPPLGLPPIISF